MNYVSQKLPNNSHSVDFWDIHSQANSYTIKIVTQHVILKILQKYNWIFEI